MARGWDEGGALIDYSSWRSLCGAQGSGACADVLGGAGRTGFRPNVFVGLCLADNSPPAVAGGLGVSDVSLEYWHCFKIIYLAPVLLPNIPGDTTGLWLNVGGPPGMNFNMYTATAAHVPTGNPTGLNVALDPNTTVPPGVGNPVPYNVPLGWTHIAVNYDRSGFATTYINSRYENQFDISMMAAENFENSRFYAKTNFDNTQLDPTLYNGTLEDITTYWASRYIVGPISFHSRLMTAGEINRSYLGKCVQNFGAADTVLCWHWQDIERLDGGPVCWDFVEDHTHHTHVIGLQDRGIGMPLGAPGEVRVPDRSGNGNHWVLPTLETYRRTAALTELSSTAFLYDPFW